jgi:multisubunit Na+/H+ antiporter MnhB subunit
VSLVSWAAATPARKIAVIISATIGLAAIAVALIYVIHANDLPSALLDRSHHGHHPLRAVVAAVVGVVLLVLAGLVYRQPTTTTGDV